MSVPQPEVKHLMNRATFGLGVNIPAYSLNTLIKESGENAPLHSQEKPPIAERDMRMAVRDDSVRKQIMKEVLGKSRENLMKLNLEWMGRLAGQPSLRERMTFFWHGHFACRSLVSYFAQQQNNTIRTHALGSFRQLLMAVSKDPAMLQFLNNQQNRKDHPNENFAREVMELFTLGRGNYSETDVKEAARAFTGWGFNYTGEFQFRPRQHDQEIKSFRGQSKNFSGEDILNAILDDRQTARFITTKLYKHFVSEQVSSDAIREWSESFYKSDYDIGKLMNTIFKSQQFLASANMGNRIKSPIELLAGFQLHTGGKFENPQSLLFLQRALGQVAFYPPNVSGWPSGKAWIDSSSLAFRIALPMMLFGGTETDFQATDDGDANGLGKAQAGTRRLHCKADWKMLAGKFNRSSQRETYQASEDFLLSRPTSESNRDFILKATAGAKSEEESLKKIFIGIMSLPEYQLC